MSFEGDTSEGSKNSNSNGGGGADADLVYFDESEMRYSTGRPISILDDG